MSDIQAAAIDPRQFRNTLGRFASGVTVITTQYGDQPHGMTANAFVSVSLKPPLVLVSVDNRAMMNRLLPQTRRFGVSILAEGQEYLSNHFAGRTFEEIEVRFIRRREMPLIDDAAAYLVAAIVDIHIAGDHTLYIGEVAYIEWTDTKPLLFYAGRYHQLPVERMAPLPWPEDEFSLFSIGSIDPPVK